MSSAIPTGMFHFLRLNNAVYLHEPTEKRKSSDEPDLILLVGWMGASLRHLTKYKTSYERLYPSARILVVQTEAVHFFLTRSGNLKRVAPVLEVLYGLPPGSRFLLHFFSNGGAWTTSTIANAYQEKTGRPMPANAMILDSTPGKATFKATILAFSVGLPENAFIRFLAVGMLQIVLALYMLPKWTGYGIDIVERTRLALNNMNLFDTSTPRLYMYSSADPMVNWRFVEEHEADAKALGYSVSSEKYDESGHCMHMLLDQGRYWGAVKKLWGMGSS